MEIKTLKELSFDSDNKRYVVKCTIFKGYDFDGFVKNNIKPNGYDYKEDTKATVDAVLDTNLFNCCQYVNFIEFKSGTIDLKSIRKKAIDSISLYGEYSKISDLKKLPKNRRFLLIYRNKSNQNLKVRVRRIIRALEKDIVVSECYDAGLKYYSGKEFDVDPKRYLN